MGSIFEKRFCVAPTVAKVFAGSHQNMMACNEEMSGNLSAASIPDMPQFKMHITVKFDTEQFDLWYLDEPKESDRPIFDIFLNILRRRQVRLLEICSSECTRIERQIFSTEAFQQFLTENDELKDLSFHELRMRRVIQLHAFQADWTHFKLMGVIPWT
jgi:hypothetical protein